MTKKLTRAQEDEIRRRFEAGELKKDIAYAMKLAESTVRRYTPKVNLPGFSEVQIQEIAKRIENGESKVSIARSLGVTEGRFYKLTRLIRIAGPETSEEKKAEVRRRIHAGDSIASIARALQMDTATAWKFAHRAIRNYELRDDQKEVIQAAYAQGKPFMEIASDLSIPVPIVQEALGIRLGQRHPFELKQAVIRGIESGEKVSDVAKRFGVSLKAAWEWFHTAVKRGEARRPEKPPGKRDDLQFNWISRKDPQLVEWQALIVGWFKSKRHSTGDVIAAINAFIERYLIAANLPRKPADLLQRGRVLPDFYATACPRGPHGRRYNLLIFELIEWVLDSPGFADNDGSETLRIVDLYRNPIKPNVSDGESPRVNTESNKVVLPYFIIADLRKRIVQGPNFKDWSWVQGLMGFHTVYGQQRAGDWFEVTEDQIDRNDPDCVWRTKKRANLAPVLEMWSPVRWVHALVHLQTTTRGGQLRMVDSGEADTYIWRDNCFIFNPGHLRQGTARNPTQRGVLRRTSPEDVAHGAKICLYFNSNKTADRGKSHTNRGFECAWPRMPDIVEDPYYWLSKLRDWQMKYNPINRLTPWRELKGQSKLSAMTEEQASQYADTAFLFRAAEYVDHPAWPIGTHDCYKAWQRLLASYEAILADEGIRHPSGEPIQLINPESGVAWSSPHATRTSLITHLILDGNVPPVVMMKIAGHARFIMTIYYTKASLAGIQNAIRDGTKKIEVAKYETFERDLLGAKAEQMRSKAVFNAEDWQTVIPVNPADRNPLGWMHMHDGICLAGGNTGGDPTTPGCHSGGPAAIKAEQAGRSARHGPVLGGVRNCCRCRWKAAGKQHLLGLAATYDNRAYHMHKVKDEAIAAERERNRLMQDKARVESSNEPYTRMRDLIDAERRYESAMQKFQELALDLAALHRTIDRVMALPDNVDGPTALAAQCDLMTVNMFIEDTDSELLQLATVCADVELFPDLDPGTAIFEFAQILDYAFEREGQSMVLARMSEKEKLAAANAIMRELERKANPDNFYLGRRRLVEIMDRGESLEKMLGINLTSVLQLTKLSGGKPISVCLVNNELEAGNDDDKRHTS